MDEIHAGHQLRGATPLVTGFHPSQLVRSGVGHPLLALPRYKAATQQMRPGQKTFVYSRGHGTFGSTLWLHKMWAGPPLLHFLPKPTIDHQSWHLALSIKSNDRSSKLARKTQPKPNSWMLETSSKKHPGSFLGFGLLAISRGQACYYIPLEAWPAFLLSPRNLGG